MRTSTCRPGDTLNASIPELGQRLELTLMKIQDRKIRIRVSCPLHWRIEHTGHPSLQYGSIQHSGWAIEELTLALNEAMTVRVMDIGAHCRVSLIAIKEDQSSLELRYSDHWIVNSADKPRLDWQLASRGQPEAVLA